MLLVETSSYLYFQAFQEIWGLCGHAYWVEASPLSHQLRPGQLHLVHARLLLHVLGCLPAKLQPLLEATQWRNVFAFHITDQNSA